MTHSPAGEPQAPALPRENPDPMASLRLRIEGYVGLPRPRAELRDDALEASLELDRALARRDWPEAARAASAILAAASLLAHPEQAAAALEWRRPATRRNEAPR